jgi:hypothetical protein
MIFNTANSTYEVDTDNKRIRRLVGKNAATVRQGNGEWRSYDSIHPDPIMVGESVAIFWSKDVPLLDETPEEERAAAVPATITSVVMSVA